MSRGVPSPAQLAARIKPGQVLNPNGRPKKVLTAQELLDRQIRKDIRQAAKDHSPEAFRFLLETMRNQDASLQYRMDAAKTIIDRGWGKPVAQTDINVNVYERMNEVELIKLITGEEIDSSLIEAEVQDEEDSEEE
jgi:hypothetical protein